MSAIFQYDRVMRLARGLWTNDEIRFFGYVVSGELSINDTVFVPVVGGRAVAATVVRFTEDFSEEWCGLPFYDRVGQGSCGDSFCVGLNGMPLHDVLIANPAQLVAP